MPDLDCDTLGLATLRTTASIGQAISSCSVEVKDDSCFLRCLFTGGYTAPALTPAGSIGSWLSSVFSRSAAGCCGSASCGRMRGILLRPRGGILAGVVWFVVGGLVWRGWREVGDEPAEVHPVGYLPVE